MIQNKILLQVLIIALSFLFPLTGSTQDAIGKINWEDGFASVTAYGTARPSGNGMPG